VTSNQDFFGISSIEAIAAGCIPILPNRLAFPEHLSEENHQAYYYNTPQEFTDKLSLFINQQPSSSPSLRNYILKYDLEIVVPRYDAFFENIALLK